VNEQALSAVLRRTAAHLVPQREAVVESWAGAVAGISPGPPSELRSYCSRTVDALLGHLARGDLAGLLAAEAAAAGEAARAGASLLPLALAIRVLDRCCLPHLAAACPDRESLAESLLALDELGDRRLEVLLRAQEEESARRLIDAEEQAARARERARELALANDALRRADAQSRHRAEQITLLHSVAHRLAGVLDPESLLQVAAETIQARLNHPYVAVVIVDDDGALVGRWAGRRGIDRREAGRTQGPPRGIIGRALRKRAPQVVGDVGADPDYHPDVPGTRSEMAIPLLDAGSAVGALDFQSDRPDAFDLDAVAAGEILSEFLVVALRNARRFAAGKGAGGGEG
jgi:putative methionine-R-sulfoxide reductase with GAF domain